MKLGGKLPRLQVEVNTEAGALANLETTHKILTAINNNKFASDSLKITAPYVKLLCMNCYQLY